MIIKLTYYELINGASVGIMRKAEQWKRGVSHKYNGVNLQNDYQVDIVGALGEMAVAKCLEVYWPGKGMAGEGDLGRFGEVRASCNPDARCLILHPSDHDDSLYYFAFRLSEECYEIYNPVLGRDGKQPKYWRPNAKYPAFFVPVTPMQAPEVAA